MLDQAESCATIGVDVWETFDDDGAESKPFAPYTPSETSYMLVYERQTDSELRSQTPAFSSLASQELVVKLLTDFAHIGPSVMQKSAVGQCTLTPRMPTLSKRSELLTIDIFQQGIDRILAAVGNADLRLVEVVDTQTTESVTGPVEHDQVLDTLRKELARRGEELAKCQGNLVDLQELNADFMRNMEAGTNEQLGELTAKCLVRIEKLKKKIDDLEAERKVMEGKVSDLEGEKNVTDTLTNVRFVFDLKPNSSLSPRTAGARIRSGSSETEDTGIKYCTYKSIVHTKLVLYIQNFTYKFHVCCTVLLASCLLSPSVWSLHG